MIKNHGFYSFFSLEFSFLYLQIGCRKITVPEKSISSETPGATAPPCRRGRRDSAWSAWPGVACPRRPCDLGDDHGTMDDPHFFHHETCHRSGTIIQQIKEKNPDLMMFNLFIYEFFFDFLLLGVYLPTCWMLNRIFLATLSPDRSSFHIPMLPE